MFLLIGYSWCLYNPVVTYIRRRKKQRYTILNRRVTRTAYTSSIAIEQGKFPLDARNSEQTHLGLACKQAQGRVVLLDEDSSCLHINNFVSADAYIRSCRILAIFYTNEQLQDQRIQKRLNLSWKGNSCCTQHPHSHVSSVINTLQQYKRVKRPYGYAFVPISCTLFSPRSSLNRSSTSK